MIAFTRQCDSLLTIIGSVYIMDTLQLKRCTMEWIESYFYYVTHIDKAIAYLIDKLGVAIYFVLFGIIFAETGLLIFSFLPGDSLLFASGAFAGADNVLNIWILMIGFFLAAMLGSVSSYKLGDISEQLLERSSAFRKVVTEEKLLNARAFFEKYGAMAIIAARFMPVFRAIIPFVAGASKMPFSKFITYNIIGALIWGVGCTMLGYFLGSIPWVTENFSIILYAIMFTTFIPPIVTVIRAKMK